jgi:hypothetical protein
MMFDDKAIEAAQSRMESKRWAVDAECGEVGAIILDEDGTFSVRYAQEGRTGSGHVYDEYGAQAHQDGVSLFEGFTMPRGQKWQKIRLLADRIMENVANLQWLEKVEDRLFALRNDPKSGFTTALHQSVESLLALWGQSLWVDKRFDVHGRFEGFSYQSEDVAGVWIERDAAGNVMRVHRKLLVLNAEQICRKWPEKAPPKAREAMAGDNPRPDTPFEILHVIERNDAMIPGRMDAAGKAWRACYYSVSGQGRVRDRRLSHAAADRELLFAQGGDGLWAQPGDADAAGAAREPDHHAGSRAGRGISAEAADAGQQRRSGPGHHRHVAMGDHLWRAGRHGQPEDPAHVRFAVDLQGAKALHAEVRSVIDKGFFRDLLQLFREMKTHITALRTSEEIAEKGVLLSPLARQEQEFTRRRWTSSWT